jgi:hypothetical protein
MFRRSVPQLRISCQKKSVYCHTLLSGRRVGDQTTHSSPPDIAGVRKADGEGGKGEGNGGVNDKMSLAISKVHNPV